MTETKILWCKNYSEIIIIQLVLTGTEACMCAHERDIVRFKRVLMRERRARRQIWNHNTTTCDHRSQSQLQDCSVQLHTPREGYQTEQIFFIITVVIKKKKVGAMHHINMAGNRLTDPSVSMKSREKNPSGRRCSVYSPTSSLERANVALEIKNPRPYIQLTSRFVKQDQWKSLWRYAGETKTCTFLDRRNVNKEELII